MEVPAPQMQTQTTIPTRSELVEQAGFKTEEAKPSEPEKSVLSKLIEDA